MELLYVKLSSSSIPRPIQKPLVNPGSGRVGRAICRLCPETAEIGPEIVYV